MWESGSGQWRPVALFPEDRAAPQPAQEVIHIRLDQVQVERPRQWGACWLACELWQQLRWDSCWEKRLPPSRPGTDWLQTLPTLVAYRRIDPGSAGRRHREWYPHTAMGDLLDGSGETME